jgi:hypothetical protein
VSDHDSERPTGPVPADAIRRAEAHVRDQRKDLERFEQQLHSMGNLAAAGDKGLPLSQIAALMRSKADDLQETATRLHFEAGRLMIPRIVDRGRRR